MKTFFISFILFIGLAFALPIESGDSPLGGLPVVGGLLGGNGSGSPVGVSTNWHIWECIIFLKLALTNI